MSMPLEHVYKLQGVGVVDVDLVMVALSARVGRSQEIASAGELELGAVLHHLFLIDPELAVKDMENTQFVNETSRQVVAGWVECNTEERIDVLGRLLLLLGVLGAEGGLVAFLADIEFPGEFASCIDIVPDPDGGIRFAAGDDEGSLEANVDSGDGSSVGL